MEEENLNTAFEREKWEAGLVRQDKELSIKERDLDLRREEVARSRWSTPIGLAIVGAILAALGSVLTTYLTSASQQNIEEKTAESQRILQMITTGGDAKKAAKNLRLLADTKLVSPERQKDIETYLHDTAPDDTAALGQAPAMTCAGRRPGDACGPGLVCNPAHDCVPGP
jgi:hypothetical protein